MTYWIYIPEGGFLAFSDFQSQKNFTSAAKCDCKRNVLHSPASAEDSEAIGGLLTVSGSSAWRRSRLDLMSGSSNAQGNIAPASRFMVQFSQLRIFLYFVLAKGPALGITLCPVYFQQ